jgi:hypothetical protein
MLQARPKLGQRALHGDRIFSQGWINIHSIPNSLESHRLISRYKTSSMEFVYSEPASCISFDVWLRYANFVIFETNVRLKVSPESSGAVSTPNDPPMIVKLSPSWMSRIKPKPKETISVAIPRNLHKTPRIFEGKSVKASQSMTTDWTVRAISSLKNRQITEWQIRKLRDPYASEPSLHVRMAVIVEHGNRPFSLEVVISRNSKSGLQKLTMLRDRPFVHKTKIIPETESDLEVDLDQRRYMVDPLLNLQDNVRENEEVGLEYDGERFTMRLSENPYKSNLHVI